ncbi:winged helix DNA-binding domain-containing protein [Streptomyces sp. NBC_00162]|uniref:winged helix DNA-binding domain-containing protein n=1 Tax=Streptomyces sp. NBC_00162 TaxID=2903629 RepID=UPI00214AB559|nr:winged helix DNA-binding domain-containing protein [Streptomyces sp. NBC_00162]UUU38179.1 winged helix DNA-binding domain-containing protein [Streptomyces sp. NBC_00162]
MTARKSTGGTAAEVRTSDVIAFRLNAHHLTNRQPVADLHRVAGACGIQNSPPGSALLALHSRIEEVNPDRVDHLVGEEKSLLQTWCMRGAPFYFPTVDAPVFTTGVLPATEAARLHLISGIDQALNKLGMGLDEAVEITAEEIGAVLSERQLAINELGEELADRIAGRLSPAQRKTWQAKGPYGANQPLGEAVVHFCIRMLMLRGVVCIAPRSENKAPFVLFDEWLGRPLPQVDPDSARAGLLRRYLHCYGPSTRRDFATWVGVHAGDVDPWWTTLEDELIPVEFDGHRAWILADDREALQSPSETRGVRLLPPRDPYTQMRDRETIVDKKHHRHVWKSVGEPGAVLADGTIAGIWRPRKSGRQLALTVETFRSLSTELRKQLREEADHVAELRGASGVQVTFDDETR